MQKGSRSPRVCQSGRRLRGAGKPQSGGDFQNRRQFMTKLHIQVNQTLQFYRGQQGGTAPQRLYLRAAPRSCLTRRNFSRKNECAGGIFQSFRNVQIDPAVNLEDLSRWRIRWVRWWAGFAESGALSGGNEFDAGQHVALAGF